MFSYGHLPVEFVYEWHLLLNTVIWSIVNIELLYSAALTTTTMSSCEKSGIDQSQICAFVEINLLVSSLLYIN